MSLPDPKLHGDTATQPNGVNQEEYAMRVSMMFGIPFLSAAALVAGGCGESSTAEFRLMDAPPAGVTSVKIFVASIQVHVDDKTKTVSDPADVSIDNDSKWQTFAVGRSIDLVQYQGESAALVLGQLPLPLGKITQVRLVIDKTKPNTATLNGVVCNLDVTKIADKGIKIDHVFKAFESKNGSLHQMWIDFKLDEALKPAGTCFELQPKLKLVKVKTDGKDEVL